MPFVFEKQKIEDVILIKSDTFFDSRGYFREIYKKSVFQDNGITDDFLQDNFSLSNKNVIRGMHFQNPPFEQSKLVQCIQGGIIDIVVDIRKNSKSYKKFIKVELNEENKSILYIPKGFAHGFLSLKDNTLIHYKTSNEYNKDVQNGFIWNDKEINITWDINFKPVLSQKDLNLKSFYDIFEK